ncbi:hypothetical protein NMG60_11001130 [Bertholletia excelsa]
MTPNPGTLLRRASSVLSFRFMGSYSNKPISYFGNRVTIPRPLPHVSSFRSVTSCDCHLFPLNSSGLKEMVGSEREYRLLSPGNFRVLATSDGYSGGTGGGGYGSFGGGNSGGNGERGGDGSGRRSNWSFLSWYLSLLEKYPMLTKAVTSALLTFIGDLICQVVIDQVPSLDKKRIFLFSLLGLVLVGPTLHFWYLYLSKLVTLPGASGAFLRLLLDQFLFSPIFIGVFLSTLVTLEGRPSEVVPKLKQEWFSSVLANWQLWIPFQFLNFRFVPQQFQVLAANVIALVWNVILSYKAHKEVLP